MRRALPERYERACMVGDRAGDMEGALGNGIDGIGALYGYGTREELEDAGAEEAPPAVDNAPEDAALPEEAGGREAPPVEETGALPQAARKNASVRQNAKAVIFFIVVLLCRPAGTARFQCKCCGRETRKRRPPRP